MSARFYTTAIDLKTMTAQLNEGEAHHLLHVMRMKVGEEVTLFDGQGNAWKAEIKSTTRRTVDLALQDQIATPVPDHREVVLAVTPPKGDRFRWLVEKVTELGIDTLVPIKTTRSVVDPGQGKIDKLVQTMIAACKQCQRNRLMEFRSQQDWNELLQNYHQSHQILLAHPDTKSLKETLSELDSNRPVLFAIGPEGGFTDEEVSQALELNARTISLGETILRTETACIALSAAVLL
ncbi:MAG: RsmE family RNA methyltransferase [Planctomycetaceae bacterium]